ncbi:uncharacterized protein G2W53_020920 [Senna tora]|uniref:Uncharacterized protein n=1 Tax=Senna tora TaxID=362788 RepID=A0A834TKZ9_9FABA|nr:uncharacterized protein G2W53_020920 [Senna tora]
MNLALYFSEVKKLALQSKGEIEHFLKVLFTLFEEADQNQKACYELEKLNLQEEERKPQSKGLYDTLYDLFQKEAKQLKKRYRDEKKRRANSSSSDANASSCNIIDPLASIQRPEEDDGSAMDCSARPALFCIFLY